jgi:prophage antirepressor-like protein
MQEMTIINESGLYSLILIKEETAQVKREKKSADNQTALRGGFF